MRAFAILFLASSALAVQLELKPFKRLIPADVLRDFRDSCFASTQCKVYGPGETWSLAPFCGASKCVKLESGRLAEEVTDCGPVIDLKATPGCQLLKDEADPKAAFPACCPVYDCEEDTEVKYVKTPAQKKKEASSVGSTKEGAGTSVEN
eukprot:TRINITY_DN95_c0_g1_i2.p1 TRINITY_DN95_c0_g1~~TRINITY_DN95_c0_g1_i2.p1  ORF type:complete len:150 (-),score=27.63 TRINITY_DN95_c0_g1_i2:86-535(-)